MRTILRSLLILIVVVAAVLVLLGFLSGSSWRGRFGPASTAVGTSGYVDTQRAREVGAEIGEKAAIATQEVKDTAHDAAITAKIKAKMALDDRVKARAIDVSTTGSTVTLTGTVSSASERDRAVALARETVGVSVVIDRLETR